MTAQTRSDAAAARPSTLATWYVNWRLIQFNPGVFAIHATFAILFFWFQILPGLIQKSVFDGISGAQPAQGLAEQSPSLAQKIP